MSKICVGVGVIVSCVLVAKGASAQCQRDTDCKGDRVCVGGQCMDRQAAAPAQPAQPAYPQPAQPAQPAYPQPAQPAQPAYPQPAQPAQPAYPQPAQPAQPAYGQPAAYAPTAPVAPAPVGSFADRGVIFGVDRAFGAQAWSGSATFTTAGGAPVPATASAEFKHSGTTLSFMTGTSGTNNPDFNTNPSSVPRFSIDGVPVKGFTIGGSLGYFSVSGDRSPPSPAPSETLDTTTGLVITPRVGLLVSPSPFISLWPRLGITYASITIEDKQGSNSGAKDEVSLQQVNLEGLLLVTPSPHFAISFGLTADVGVGGSLKSTSSTGVTIDEADLKHSSYGLNVGVHGHL